ncbi:MAG: ATP-binding cassette domain-containing protein [Lachnospiraceae bacterium]
MELIKTEHLVKKYKKYCAVNEVTMTINKGDIYGFIGRNGAGKTTFIRLLTQLIKKNSGSLIFGQESLKIGAVIEGPACYPYLSARENLTYYAIQNNIKNKKRIEEVLKFIGLAEVDPKKKYKDYSLGMRQRLGIGLAILDEPDFLILDEPTNGLDPQGIVEIREIIQRLNQEYGTTILISSHILSELSLVATRYGIINKGVLIKELTKTELENECQQVLIIETSDNHKAQEVLRANEYQVNDESTHLILIEEKQEMPIIAKKLFDQKIYSTNFYCKEQNLEDYYLSLLGE